MKRNRKEPFTKVPSLIKLIEETYFKICQYNLRDEVEGYLDYDLLLILLEEIRSRLDDALEEAPISFIQGEGGEWYVRHRDYDRNIYIFNSKAQLLRVRKAGVSEELLDEPNPFDSQSLANLFSRFNYNEPKLSEDCLSALPKQLNN